MPFGKIWKMVADVEVDIDYDYGEKSYPDMAEEWMMFTIREKFGNNSFLLHPSTVTIEKVGKPKQTEGPRIQKYEVTFYYGRAE